MKNSLVQGTIKTARRAIIISFFATMLIVAVLIAERFNFEKTFDLAAARSVDSASISGQIILEDERLTMSANMAAATGELTWVQRYIDHVAPMTMAIRKGQELASKEIAANFNLETKTANDALIALENKAFVQVKLGNLDKAAAILNGEEYSGQKQILAAGTQRYLSTLTAENRTQIDEVKTRGKTILASLILLILIGAAGLWWGLNRKLYRSEIENLHIEQRLNMRAMHDELTGLFNRGTFIEHVTIMLERCKTTKIGMVAVAMIDLDHFKDVNDTLGHYVGDELIRSVAQRIDTTMPDGSIVARFGGDEFVVAINVLDETHLKRVSQSLPDVFIAPFEFEEEVLRVTASIGLALGPIHGEDASDLLRVADIALYEAKDDGRSNMRLFDPEMDVNVKERKLLESDLTRAVQRNQLSLHYQPQMSSNGDQVTGLEALVRWQHPERGMISPGIFIPIAERCGLIIELGRWVMKQAFQDAARWPGLMVAVNLSPNQFRHPDFLWLVDSLVKKTGVDPHRIELEVTENLLLEDSDHVHAVFSRLNEMGFRISLDDFGTGYSSLSYLRNFPFNKIKIDQSFIKGIETSDEAVEIIRSVVNLGKALHMTVTTEGVETDAQLHFLRSAGCQQLQGYLFARPMPADEIDTLFDSKRRAAVA